LSNCNDLITGGIILDCNTINAAVGVDSDLILVNYADFDKTATLAAREISGSNIGGLTAIELKSGAIQYVFEGTDYSVIPNITAELKDDGNAWYLHSIAFTVYSKLAADRKVLEDLGNSLVIAIAKDRSTGLYEIFGMDQGLKLSGLEGAYVGAQTSNFYTVTIATPDVAVIRESTIGELAVGINTAV